MAAKTCPSPAACHPSPDRERNANENFPWDWSVYTWLEGEAATMEGIDDPRRAATKLGEFVAAMQQIDPAGGPHPDGQNSFRGVPLSRRDSSTRDAIASLRKTHDTDALTAVWEDALNAPVWQGGDVWLHGDLHGANLLAQHGRLRAVIDFGCMAVGDPACDVMVAWTYLSAQTRDVFRSAVAIDDATWARGRGWALSFGLIALLYYQATNPILAAIARRSIKEVLADDDRSSGGC